MGEWIAEGRRGSWEISEDLVATALGERQWWWPGEDAVEMESGWILEVLWRYS